MKTIRFQDNGQDFLTWDLNDAGIVMACRPCQGFIWEGSRVLNPIIKPGDFLRIITKSEKNLTPIHRVESVTRLRGAKPVQVAS